MNNKLFLLFFVIPSLAFSYETKAKNAYVVDAHSGLVLYEKKADIPMPPASMSKLMTLALLFRAIETGKVTLDSTFTVSERAHAIGGSTMFLEIGQEVSIRDLIAGIIVLSGNDACIVVAEGLAGTEKAFAAQMNDYAKVLGLEQSSFGNASGWPDPKQLMSAKDLVTLAQFLKKNHNEHWHYFQLNEYTYNGITQPNRNPLLGGVVEGAEGLKTGHTEDAGYGLTAAIARDDREIFFTLMGLESQADRTEEAKAVANWATNTIDIETALKAGEPLLNTKGFLLQNQEIALTTPNNISYIRSISEENQPVFEVTYLKTIKEPVKAGEKLGVVTVKLGEEIIGTQDLVALENVERLSGFKKFTTLWLSGFQSVWSKITGIF